LVDCGVELTIVHGFGLDVSMLKAPTMIQPGSQATENIQSNTSLAIHMARPPGGNVVHLRAASMLRMSRAHS